MREAEVEIIVQRAREQVPEARPRIISDNGPQFIARDFKSLLRIAGMTHVRTSPYYPQSNGKLERYHRTIKSDALRVQSISSPDQAGRAVEQFVTRYNAVRLHSAIGFVGICTLHPAGRPRIFHYLSPTIPYAIKFGVAFSLNQYNLKTRSLIAGKHPLR